MKRWILIFLLLPLTAWAAHKDDSLTVLGDGNKALDRKTRTLGVGDDGRMMVLLTYGTDSLAYFSSTNNGETWTAHSLSIASQAANKGVFYGSASYEIGASMAVVGDTGYIYAGQKNYANWIYSKIHDASVDIDQDIVYTGAIPYSPFVCMGIRSDGTSIALVDSAGPRAISFTTSEVWNVSSTWTRQALQAIGTEIKAIPLHYGVLVADINSTTNLRFYFTDGTTWTATTNLTMRTPDGGISSNYQLTSFGYSDTVFYVGMEVAESDSLVCYRMSLDPSTHAVSISNTVSINEAGTAPAGNSTDNIRRCPSVGLLGDSVYYFYKYWSDPTGDADNIAICYRSWLDKATSSSARKTLRVATGTDTVIFLSCPPRFYDGTTDIIWAEWQNSNNAVRTRGIFIHVDTVSAGGPSTPSPLTSCGADSILSDSGGTEIDHIRRTYTKPSQAADSTITKWSITDYPSYIGNTQRISKPYGSSGAAADTISYEGTETYTLYIRSWAKTNGASPDTSASCQNSIILTAAAPPSEKPTMIRK